MMKNAGNYEIPNEMRDFAEKSVEQARKAFDGFIGAASKAAAAAETQATVASTSSREVAQKTISIPNRISLPASTSPRRLCAPKTCRN